MGAGADFNEDLSNTPKSKRTKSLEIFLSDYHLGTIQTGKTYIRPSGADTSTIDYIFFSRNLANKVRRMETLIDQHTNVSDHYPVCCSLKWHIDYNVVVKEDRLVALSQRVKWEKIGKEEYNRVVTRTLRPKVFWMHRLASVIRL